MPTLRGGKNPVRAKVALFAILGEGTEGQVFGAVARVSKGAKAKKVPLVEKRFFYKYAGHARTAKYLRKEFPLFRNPKRQLETAQRLKELDKKYGLGLRIVPTVRLRKRFPRKPALLMTRLNVDEITHKAAIKIIARVTNKRELDEALEHEANPQVIQFFEDLLRQRAAAASCGYTLPHDCFLPVFDKKEKRVVAMLADFGTVLFEP